MYGPDKTTRGFTYPSSIHNIPVVLGKTSQEGLIGLARIKGYTPNARVSKIYIFKNSFKYGRDYLLKIIQHERSHITYHTKLHIDTKEYWENISNFIPEYITKYASTQPAEDFAELVGYSYYINNDLELPSKCTWNKQIEFKYNIANNIYNGRLDERHN